MASESDWVLATWTKGEGNSPESFFENEFILETKYTVCVGLRRLRRTERGE